ncbi:helix-turn-helix domain-containing protein (plasmid) [Streptomyces sp. NBC_01005]|uniref:helix-turn-helix domain-containing protein n=1 Tax=Streptomyces sp. NBC_01005 TaxID=2903715 RepID=UPI002F907DB6|nr:helix-turn-helix domain-containing protein [Streptomyces sp. NBC_01005]WSW11544.1 helix-turn-helix domain-containing protein [Streptomyces sp. NBC_01005]
MDALSNAEWLTVSEVARHYRVSSRTVNRWALSGELRIRRIGPSGRLIRIHRSALGELNSETPSAVA